MATCQHCGRLIKRSPFGWLDPDKRDACSGSNEPHVPSLYRETADEMPTIYIPRRALMEVI